MFIYIPIYEYPNIHLYIYKLKHTIHIFREREREGGEREIAVGKKKDLSIYLSIYIYFSSKIFLQQYIYIYIYILLKRNVEDDAVVSLLFPLPIEEKSFPRKLQNLIFIFGYFCSNDLAYKCIMFFRQLFFFTFFPHAEAISLWNELLWPENPANA